MQEKYWWPKMKEWIMEYIKGFAICQQNKILTHHKKMPIFCILTEPGTLPFQSVSMNLITGLPL
jgi:hypothetical protein